MSVDLGIGTVATTLTASDPELFKSDEFRMQVMRIVQEEMAREKELSERRARDMRGLREGK
jgi:hypothetical protein